MSTSIIVTCTAQRCRKDGVPYGPVHFANDDFVTACGSTIPTDRVCVLTTGELGEATCKGCLRAAGDEVRQARAAVAEAAPAMTDDEAKMAHMVAEWDELTQQHDAARVADLPMSPDLAAEPENAEQVAALIALPKPRVKRGMGYDQAFRGWIADLLEAGYDSAAEAVGDVLYALSSTGNKWFKGPLDNFPSSWSDESAAAGKKKVVVALKKSTPLAVVLRDHSICLTNFGRPVDGAAVAELMDALVAKKMIAPPPALAPASAKAEALDEETGENGLEDDYVRLCALCGQWKNFDCGADEDGICDDCAKEYR